MSILQDCGFKSRRIDISFARDDNLSEKKISG
jgi:hypothetical protein